MLIYVCMIVAFVLLLLLLRNMLDCKRTRTFASIILVFLDFDFLKSIMFNVKLSTRHN